VTGADYAALSEFIDRDPRVNLESIENGGINPNAEEKVIDD
jgi:hypothetical protein